MKTLLIGVLATLFSNSDGYIGNWNTNKDNTTIEIYEKNDALWGKIISSENKKAKIGTNILRDFKYEKGKWVGKLYSFKMDKLVDAEMAIKKSKLQITVHAGFKKKTFDWDKE